MFLLLAFGVFAKDVYFNVECGTGGQRVEAGGGIGVGDDCNLDFVADDGGDGEADAFDGDGALRDDITDEGVGNLEAEAPVRGFGGGGCDGREGQEGAGAVDVTLNDVSSEG